MKEDLLLIECQKIFSTITNLRLIGSGGQKRVFKGNHSRFGDIVLKLIELHSENTIQRALRELEIASRLESEEFSRLYEYNYIEISERRFLYVIEEYIAGETLRSFINKNGIIELTKAIDIGKSLLKGLINVHNSNLVHRDVKPENIIINNNRIVLLDFGIARDLAKESLTADLAMFGPMTIGYAAPEQIKNQKKIICNRTDLFSWGVLMYELITGVNPFVTNAKNREEVIQNTLTKVIPRLTSGDSAIDIIISKCLEKAVHRRPSSGEEILQMIEGN